MSTTFLRSGGTGMVRLVDSGDLSAIQAVRQPGRHYSNRRIGLMMSARISSPPMAKSSRATT